MNLTLEPSQTLQVDPDGNFIFLQKNITESKALEEVIHNLSWKDHYFITRLNGHELVIEYFDAPFVAKNFRVTNTQHAEILVGDLWLPIQLNRLYLDEWDRVHGLTDKKIPYVLSENAQEDYFNLSSDFDDDSISFYDHQYPTKNFYSETLDVNESKWWNEKYQKDDKPGWDLGTFHPYLTKITATLKLNKARILVVGCGAGHDAAFFAERGHLVTAIDFSEAAINEAKKNYAHLNIKWQKVDVFQLPALYPQNFDMVFDHTLYCAVEPNRRKELVNVWRKVLVPGGHLLGIFFSLYKQAGPPFGGSEWELHERTKKFFKPFYWNRLHESPKQSRFAIEFVVYAELRKNQL